MTNDLVAKWEISRRRVLAGLGVAGASLAAGSNGNRVQGVAAGNNRLLLQPGSRAKRRR